MEARDAPGMATLRHHDAVVACFRRAGFSLALIGHAYAVIDAFLYGFALQEATLPATADAERRAASADQQLTSKVAAVSSPYGRFGPIAFSVTVPETLPPSTVATSVPFTSV